MTMKILISASAAEKLKWEAKRAFRDLTCLILKNKLGEVGES